MAHGSWLMAHGSWLMAHGSSLIAHRSSLIAHRSSLIAHRSWLMAHGSERPAGSNAQEDCVFPVEPRSGACRVWREGAFVGAVSEELEAPQRHCHAEASSRGDVRGEDGGAKAYV